MSGELFGPYRLEELIGQGGMGEVYRAFDTGRKRVVALKRLPAGLAADPEFQARFRAESELAAGLRSAHVIPIHDYGEIDGRLFIDMRLVDGGNLEDRLKEQGAMPAADAVHVIGQVAGALDAAHAAGLVHRDVKPSNVLLSPGDSGDGRDFAYLADFGLARAVDATAGLTSTGAIIGTVGYMAPERFEGRPVDHRTDVYSLACMLSQALTGSPPFRCDSMAGAMYHHLHAPPPRPSQLLPGVPTAFDTVVLRGMAKDPRDRYPSAGALAAAARAALAAGVPLTNDPYRSAHADPPGVGTTDSTRSTGAGWSSTAHPLPSTPGLVAAVEHPPPGAGRRVADGGARRIRWWTAGLVAVLLVAAALAAGMLLERDPAVPRTVRVAENLTINAAGGVAIDPTGTRFYVSAPGDYPRRRVEIRTTSDNALVGAVPLPDEYVAGLALAPDGKRLFVVTWTRPIGGATTANLTVIDTATQAATTTMPLSPAFSGPLAVSPDGSRVYVLSESTLEVIDPATRRSVASIPLGGRGEGVAVTPDGRQVLATGSAGVKIINTVNNTVATTVGLHNDPAGIAITPDGRRALIATPGGNAVATLDLDSAMVTGAIPVGERPQDVTVTPNGAQALVANNRAGTVSVISLANGAVSTLSVGANPQAIAVSPDGRFGFVVTSSNVVRFEWVTS